MTYTSKRERLSEAVDRMMKAAGISREQAETDLCRALSDGDIEVRIKLAKHSFRLQTSSEDPVRPAEWRWVDVASKRANKVTLSGRNRIFRNSKGLSSSQISDPLAAACGNPTYDREV